MTRREVLKRLSLRELGVEEAERLLSAEVTAPVPQPAAPPPRRGGCGCGCLVIVIVIVLLLLLSAAGLLLVRRATCM